MAFDRQRGHAHFLNPLPGGFHARIAIALSPQEAANAGDQAQDFVQGQGAIRPPFLREQIGAVDFVRIKEMARIELRTGEARRIK